MYSRKSKGARTVSPWLVLLLMSLTLVLMSGNLAAAGEKAEYDQSSDFVLTANSNGPAPLMIVPRPPEKNTGLDVRIWTNKKVYQIDENARVFFELNKSAYVYILDYTPRGNVHLIYPNKWEGNERRGPGTHSLPSGNYQFGVTGPTGTEYLQALATTKKLDIYQYVKHPNDPFRESGFPEVPDPQNLKEKIKSGLQAKFGLHIGGEDSKIQFQLTPVEWDTDFYDFNIVSSQPTNQPPTARFSYNPTNPASGERVRFDGSNSYDPDGNIVRWRWDFDSDGDVDAVGRQGYNTYTGTGRVKVRLTVTDNDGATSSTSQYVQVGPRNRSPQADFEYNPRNPSVGEVVQFDGTLSSDPDGYISSWSWDFNGDGNTDRTGRVVWNSFSTSGTRTVRLTVRDNQGATSTTSKTIQVGPSRPRFNQEEADDYYSNGSMENGWYWHRNFGTYSRWTWYSLPNRPNRAYLNFDLLVTNRNGGSGYGAVVKFAIEDLNGNIIERGSVDLANTYRPQYSGDTNGVGYEASGSYRVSNASALRNGFRVRVEWPPRDNRYYFGTRRSSVKLAYEY
ncbi:MAG: PKD domain-containing protein [Candidatus Bipolaricaulia bacterium]